MMEFDTTPASLVSTRCKPLAGHSAIVYLPGQPASGTSGLDLIYNEHN
jgi:hypothetical protein